MVRNLKAQMVDLRTVEVTWNPPRSTTVTDIGGYWISVPTALKNVTVNRDPHRITLPVGNHTIRVQTISRHFLSLPVTKYNVTVRGKSIYCACANRLSHYVYVIS